MKLTDFLQDVGRPIAYHPKMKRITGSTNATILLCQFIYWRGKENDPDGWLYKTADDIEEETGLSYGEQKTARRDLVSAGLLEEYYARLDHQMKFRLLLDVINEKWGTGESHIPESGKPTFGNEANPLSLNESETTTETTQKKGDLIDGLLFYGKQAEEQKLDNIEELLQEMERGLRVNISRSTSNQAVAKRILKDGRPFGKWLTWCVSDEWRAAHLYMYADLEKVWRDYPQAFEQPTGSNPQGLEIGL